MRANSKNDSQPFSAYSDISSLAIIGVLRQELGSWRWTAFVVAYELILAYAVAWIVYVFVRCMGLNEVVFKVSLHNKFEEVVSILRGVSFVRIVPCDVFGGLILIVISAVFLRGLTNKLKPFFCISDALSLWSFIHPSSNCEWN